jgi:hypothetical protein
LLLTTITFCDCRCLQIDSSVSGLPSVICPMGNTGCKPTDWNVRFCLFCEALVLFVRCQNHPDSRLQLGGGGSSSCSCRGCFRSKHFLVVSCRVGSWWQKSSGGWGVCVRPHNKSVLGRRC